MSLKKLMTNFFTVQTSKDSSPNNDGSIDRSGSWINIPEFINIKGHIQEKKRQTINETYHRQDEEHNDVIYHLNVALNNYTPSVSIRMLAHNNPLNKIIFPIVESDNETFDQNNDRIDIYQFKGHIEQVKGVRHRYKFFILACERNNRWVA